MYSKALLTKETEAQNFDIDVTGVGKLEYEAVELEFSLWKKEYLLKQNSE